MRVRRHRQRRERGDVPISAVLSHGFVVTLIDFGWLPFDQRDDRRVVAAVPSRTMTRAMAAAISGIFGSNALRRCGWLVPSILSEASVSRQPNIA